jgi:hypothetical protein
MLHYNGGMSGTNIQVQRTRKIMIFRTMILKKNPSRANGVKKQRQSATSLAYKVCFT